MYGYRKLHDDLLDQGETCCALTALHSWPNWRVSRRRVRYSSTPARVLSFTSIDWASFLKQHNLEHTLSRRGNCHDNAVSENFFNLLKRERIRRRTCKTRADARQDVFDYIEMFYNPKRKHVRNRMLSPVEFERQQDMKTEGVWNTRGYSEHNESIRRTFGLSK